MHDDYPIAGDRPSVCRAIRALVFAGLVALTGVAGVAPAGAHEPSRPHHAGHDRPLGPGWPGPELYPPYYPAIGIDARPQLEHWPSDYWPDDYHLPGYDGRPAGRHICRGAHGATLSSAGRACPKGEKKPAGGRHLSTDGR